MLARVIPLKRLPRPLGIFDYLVPKVLEERIRGGQLVTIPFRKSEIFGLVFSARKSGFRPPGSALKKITDIKQDEPIVNLEHLKFLETLGQWYGVPLATLAKMSLLPLQKRKLKKLNLTPYTVNPNKNLPPAPITSHLYTTPKQHGEALKKTSRGVTLLLVPEVHLIDEVRQLLPIKLQQQAVVWHGQLSDKQKFERWLQIRNGKRILIIGTRTAALIPIPHLQSIIIDYEHDENHKHWDQAPRFHVKDVAARLASINQASLHLMSFSPSCESYFQARKGFWLAPGVTNLKPSRTPVIINLSEEHRAGRYGLLADEVKERLLKAKKDVFLFINRLGFSTSVGCNTCGQRARCPNCDLTLIYHQKNNVLRCHYCRYQTKLWRSCPACNNVFVQLHGAGTEFVADGLQALFGNQLKHTIIRIDSELSPAALTQSKQVKKPRIIVGTKLAFRHVCWDQTELIVFVDTDKQLARPEYRTNERVWQTIQEILYRQTRPADFLIQTFDPRHLIFRSLNEPDRFYRTELNHRRALGYPPYQFLGRYFFGHPDMNTAKKDGEKNLTLIQQNLTKNKRRVKISALIEMHPRWYRGSFWYTIIARFDPSTWPEDLTWINQNLPGQWKIDPNPISLLTP